MLSHSDVQAALSARLDGEKPLLDDEVVDAHLEQCAQCRAYWDRLLALSNNLRFAAPAGGMAPPEDLSEVILAGVEGQWHRFAQRRAVALALSRVFLVSMALIWAAWAVRLVIQDAGASPDQAAVRLGVASALAFTAWKPGQIPGVVLIVGTMFTFTLGFAVRDILLYAPAGVGGTMAVLFFTLVALVVTWVVERGADLRRGWRMLSAEPTSS
ncbi:MULTISPECIES: zf-HC2 domain-containing protein [unclassified Corynebacterium]|uniref:zf-HC2 domain-containing protein n=1 Tax=unclassified Corynebacterium TaxID=2624378 RepID=UPI002A909FF8|nr:zf-HC2 domain-containing protein [Corynebacterium sp.]MDY5786009.1 zf-HC2 domain-containing protein [Corynebacterium sp.]